MTHQEMLFSRNTKRPADRQDACEVIRYHQNELASSLSHLLVAVHSARMPEGSKPPSVDGLHLSRLLKWNEAADFTLSPQSPTEVMLRPLGLAGSNEVGHVG